GVRPAGPDRRTGEPPRAGSAGRDGPASETRDPPALHLPVCDRSQNTLLSQLLDERLARPVNPDLRVRLGDRRDLRDLLVPLVFHLAEHERETIGLGKLRERLLESK